jgi:arginyl-tRNA synthetase
MIDTVSEEVTERAKDRELDQATKDAISIGAIKFAILRAKPGMNINFDPETSLSFEGDSGPYLQYTHARIQTLLDKGLEQNIPAEIQTGNEYLILRNYYIVFQKWLNLQLPNMHRIIL